MKPEIYAIEYPIQGNPYVASLPAESKEHANAIASALGGRVLGCDVHEVSAVPASELMRLCEALAHNDIAWKDNAEMFLEAWLACGHKVKPQER